MMSPVKLTTMAASVHNYLSARNTSTGILSTVKPAGLVWVWARATIMIIIIRIIGKCHRTLGLKQNSKVDIVIVQKTY